MEAMASGLPCIASSIRGCTDLMDGSKYLFNPKDPVELASMMEKIIDSEECQYEVERNIKNVINFDLNHAISSLKEVYESIGEKDE